MVFESVLTQLLNSVLGDYVENLDTKQLNIGIWGGDVELKNLVLKQSALDELDLPVQTVYGRIGKLVLKIPWKNLYGSAFVISVEDIYLLAQPNQQVQYDPIKENKRDFESKQKEIKKVEDAKKAEAEKDKPKADFTFVEKLITQIIKNVQLTIKNIHIRYEDKVTHPGCPFSLGITLSDLNVVSTDDTWTPAITQENISKIFKIVQLDGLAVYWNCNSSSYGNLSHVDMLYKMQTEIASKTAKPDKYSYILGPINASARLRMNQKPELDMPAFSIPKIHLNLDMERLFIGITKAQYRDIIALADSMDRMSKGIPYRKFRPNVPSYTGHYKEWWRFAYNCVVEGDIKRRKKNWDWNHILEYRSLCKEYRSLYKKKLKNNAKGDDLKRIEECEKHLDLTNIVIIRQRIELETERLLKTTETGQKKSWLGWMWGSQATAEQTEIKDSTDILKQFEAAMTPEEKTRLYKAIDYQENASPAQFPEAYVDNSCTFVLRTLEIELCDDEDEIPRVLFTELKGVKCKVDTRPAASAISVNVKIDNLSTFGLQQDDFIPKIITSDRDTSDHGLLEVAFETNPIDKSCDQRLHLTAQPIVIVYDAQTIIKVVDIFKVPQNTMLDQISAAADSGLSNFKEMSATGLQYAIEQHSRLDLRVDLHAPYVIVPYGGKHTGCENVLVANLGNFKIYSLDRSRSEQVNIRKLHSEGMKQEEILKEMIAQSYDQFKLELTDLQILMAQSDEDWKTCIKQSGISDMHILNPVSLSVTYSKCLITDDPRLPLSKITGELPSIHVNVADARLFLLAGLGTSIPLPTSEVPESQPLSRNRSGGSSMVLLKYLEMQESAKQTKTKIPKASEHRDFVQFTTVDVNFVMKECSLIITHQETITSPKTELASLRVKSVVCDLIQQTYNTRVSLQLTSISLQQNRNGNIIDIVNTPITAGEEYLFKVEFTQVDPKSPELHSLYKSCESRLMLDFGKLNVVLHQEGLLSLMQFSQDVQETIGQMTDQPGHSRIVSTRDSGIRRRLSVISEGVAQSIKAERKKKRKLRVVVETIKFKLNAKLQELMVEFATDTSRISTSAIRGITANIIIKSSYTQIDAHLQELAVIDLNPKSRHSLILQSTEGEALTAQVVMNNLENESDKPDMAVDVKMGGLRIVFLNWFVTNMLNFLNQFQAAQAKIIEASQAAAQTAKENMKDAYEKATKISLNINLKAPDIIVPVDSNSLDAMLLDLGYISLTNCFITLDVKKDDKYSAVVDDIYLSLTELKVARVKLNEKNEVEREVVLLTPLNFKLNIKRNLSTSWYRAVPDIDISGKIPIIKLQMSQADYQMIMQVLSGNLTEGQSEPVAVESSKSMDILDSDITFVSEDTNISRSTTMPQQSLTDIDPKVNIFLKFTFTMEQLIINLYTGGSIALSGNSPTHDVNFQLAKFSLEGLSLKGRILSDNSMTVSVLLVNCLLDDMRKGREDKLNRLIERSINETDLDISKGSTDSVTPTRSMIDVTYQQKGSDIFADVRVYSFTLILSVEYLFKISDFFTDPNAAEAAKQKQMKSTRAVKSTHSNKSKSTIKEVIESHMTINLKVEKPDIILVEHMDNINTNAMILNSEIVVKLRTTGNHQVMNGTIKDIHLYTCNYNPAKRAETRSNILHPVTVSLAGSTPQDKGLHLELLITEMRLSVSPATIELLNRVLNTMSTGGVKPGEVVGPVTDHSEVWNKKQFEETEYWFLKTDEALEAINIVPVYEDTTKRMPLQELCIISIPLIVVTVEAGVGNKTLPMILLETSIRGNARNWSSQLSVDASLSLQMGYYNSRLAMWEPLIEPVEITRNDKQVFAPWELKIDLSMNDQEESSIPTSPTGTMTDMEIIEKVKPPVMSFDVSSESNLELTITKTCLEVIQNLTKAFASALSTEEEMKHSGVESTYKVVNEIGVQVSLQLEKGAFKLVNAESQASDVVLKNAAEVPIQLKEIYASDAIVHLDKELISNSVEKNHVLNVRIEDKNCDLALPVVRADKRFFMLNYRGESNDNWGVISDVKVDSGVTIITLRSILQVYNHFNVPVEVYYMTPRGNELESIGIIEPGATINVPLKAVYTQTNELFFCIADYSVTTTPYIWKDLQTSLTVTKLLQCSPKSHEKGTRPFIIKAIGEMEQVYYENTPRHTMASTCYNIHLRPAVILTNSLPIEIIVCVEELMDEISVAPGDLLHLPNVDPGNTAIVIRLPEYLEKEWSCRQEIVLNPEEFAVWTFHSYDSAAKMSLDLGMHILNKNGSINMTLYCPFWMLNKTGLMIAYRNSDENLNVLHHPANFKGPILFSFNAKNFFGKKKAAIRVAQGEWSDKFSIDVAGSSGVVVCKFDDKKYQVGVHNQLTYNGLTKQVTFTPYNVIINNAPFAIECQENDRPADPWIKVEPNSCAALWPKSDLEDKLMKIRIVDTEQISAPFMYTESHTTLLKLNNRYGGINVDIQMTEGAVYINLTAYDVGMAPALLINHTSVVINYWEKQSVQVRNLEPNNQILYTWENPSGPRMIVWDKGHKKEIENDLRKDEFGEYTLELKKIYWTSFLDGMQRVLLFTEEELLAEGAQAANEIEIIQQEITFSMHGMGLSLVNNNTRQEIMYIGIASSGVIWETSKINGRRYKPLNLKESQQLENAFQQFSVRTHTDDESHTIIDNKTEVDFRSLLMFRPHKRQIRRTFQTGLWFQMRTSPTQMQLHAKINRLQIDNQMYDCIFPVVLAPVPPPKSVAIDSGIKPFVEVSIVQLLIKNSQIRQFKYFKVLVQEFHIKVDLGFVNAIFGLFENAEYSDEDQKQLFLTDMKLVDEALYSHASSQSLQEQKSFYDLLHFSPFKIHVSFSMAAGTSAGQTVSTPNFINILLQGLGVTLTDLQDVVFKLAYFERTYTFLTQRQLISEATSHYVGQSVKQLYVLVLGLDVLGNPYGLVLGITKGVEDLFYEPFQGAIQGPGEFAEGVVLGFKSLFGHTVGGAAGAAARITGAMGKGIAALTFDEDYQRKRRDLINKKPSTMQEGIARSGKGLVMGVVDGVTGVFTKPVSGAKEQGVEGFFKGLGKGAVGLVTRPAAGVIDFASGSLDVVKRATEVGEDTLRLRPPRFLQADGLVRPYTQKEAEGHKLLMDLAKGKYASTDIYVYHYIVLQKKEILLLTDKRLAYVEHNDIFGGWQVDWSYTWKELPHPAKIVPKGVSLVTSEVKKKRLFGSSDSSRTIYISDAQIKDEIYTRIETLRGS